MKLAQTQHYTREGIPLEPTLLLVRVAAGGLFAVVALIATVLGMAYF